MLKQGSTLNVKLIDAILGLANVCSDAIQGHLKPKRKEPITLCFAIYLFSRLDLEVVRNTLANGLRQILYDTFFEGLEKTFRRISKGDLDGIIKEQLGRYGEIYRTKSGGDSFAAMHDYLELVLTAASIQKKPTIWRKGTDPIVWIGIDKKLAIRGALVEIETNIIIPEVKILLDFLTGDANKSNRSEIKGEAALKQFFRETPEWKVIPESVTSELALRLVEHQTEAFVNLEHAIITNDLIEKSLVPLCKEWDDPKQVLHFFADELYRLGSESADKLLNLKVDQKDHVKDLYIHASELLQSAIVVEKEHFVAKIRLGYFYNSFGDKKSALRYMNEALADIDRMKAKPEAERSLLESVFIEEPEELENIRNKIVTDTERITLE